MVAPVGEKPGNGPPNLERRVVEEGKRLPSGARGEAEGARPVDRWLERLLERVMEEEGFRV